MATGFGVDPLILDGVATKGMESADVRKVFGGLYTPGIISGAKVTTSPSGLTYSVSNGVVAIPTAANEVVLAPAPARVITTTAPTNGSRTDIVYIKQEFSGTDSDVDVEYGITNGAIPPNSLELSRFIIPQNAANTNLATRTGAIDYSIPYGGSLGLLYAGQSTYNAVVDYPAGQDVYYLAGTFDLPTDRRLRFTVSISVSTEDGQDGTPSTWVEPVLAPQLDGVDVVMWSFRATGSWQTYTFSYDTLTAVPAGTHTVRLRRNYTVKAGRRMWIHYGGGHPGTTLSVTDLGVAQ
jgi:hypothetical protein